MILNSLFNNMKKLFSLILIIAFELTSSSVSPVMAQGIELIPRDSLASQGEALQSQTEENDSVAGTIQDLPGSAFAEPSEPTQTPSPSFSETPAFSSARPIAPVVIRALMKRSFRANEKVNIILDNAINEKVEVKIFDSSGQEVEFDQFTVDEGNRKTVVLKPSVHFKPGKYRAEISSAGQTIEQNFTWGVLAINTNKSIYSPNEVAKLSFAVLDEGGKMVCEASLKLNIKNEISKINEELSTENGGIKVNPACQKKEITAEPDYGAEFQIGSSL